MVSAGWDLPCVTKAQRTTVEKQATRALMTCSAERWIGRQAGFISVKSDWQESRGCVEKREGRYRTHSSALCLPKLHQVPFQPILPKSQCSVSPLINNGINSSMFHSWDSRVWFLPTLLRSFGPPLPLHIMHPIFFFICSIQQYKFCAICTSSLASCPIWEDTSSLISCQLWLFYFFIFSCCTRASRNNLYYIKAKPGATQQPYSYDLEEHGNI